VGLCSFSVLVTFSLGNEQDGYRYTLAEEIPGLREHFRVVLNDTVTMSGHDRGLRVMGFFLPSLTIIIVHLLLAPQTKLSEENYVVTGEKGYCMARATHG
jgi:Set1/Ash2 histone methyltransferase complex subunit ASH2